MKEKLKKIYALAMQGKDGEKEAAKKLLDKLLKKHNISIEELEYSEKEDYFVIEYHDKFELRLLVQVVYKITGGNNVFDYRLSSGRLSKVKVWVLCKKSQLIEIEFLFDFYKKLFKKEQKYLLSAFIQKHEIFPNEPAADSEPHRYTDEELHKIFSMANGLSDETPHKQLEAPKKNKT